MNNEIDRPVESAAKLVPEFLKAAEQRDSQTAWALVDSYRDINGSVVENELADSYLRERMNQNAARAVGLMVAIKFAAELEISRAGDKYEQDLANSYEFLGQARLRDLLRTRVMMEQADALFIDRNQFKDALPLYRAAQVSFRRLGDVCESEFAEYRIGHCLVRQSKCASAVAILERLRRSSEEHSYKWMEMRCRVCLADGLIDLGQYSHAVDESTRALHTLAPTDPLANHRNDLVTVLYQIGDEDRILGKKGESLAALVRGLDVAGDGAAVRDRNLWAVYTTMAIACNAQGLEVVTLGCAKEALSLAGKTKRPLYESRSRVQVALSLASLKRFADAIGYVQSGFDAADASPDPDVADNIRAYSALAAGEIYRRSGDLENAAAYYETARTLNEQLRLPDRMMAAYQGLLLTLIGQGNDARAKKELKLTLALFEKNRSDLRDEADRDSFFDQAQDIYDVGIHFELFRLRDERAALQLAETDRARFFNDLLQGGVRVVDKADGPTIHAERIASELPVHDIQRRVPHGPVILEYSVLKDRVVIWIVKHDSVDAVSRSIAADSLSQKVAAYVESIASPRFDASEITSSAFELYDILIAPAFKHLAGSKDVVIVPDKCLNYLPFEALLSRSSGRYLVEDCSIIYAPSTSIYVKCSRSASKENPGRLESLLVVADPAYDPTVFPGLSELRGASREASGLRDYYPAYRPLVGRDALKRRGLTAMKQASVIDFATHCLVDQINPLRSRLLLARDPAVSQDEQQRASSLSAADIYGMKLPRTRLVVLSACQTAIEQSFNGEGAIGMARPFIVAGVPIVVASRWAVDSEETANLMIKFHGFRRQGGKSVTTAQALAEAERESIRDSEGRLRSPYYWA
ncbi:MAG TPA: CHAT domain-containing tetratricopeptide repeat protein, partial [Blastocatellia bacterium]|nr:CHAT domain-containing tetratricopeptide repeat protein [Blastocatellia bacterium]